MNPDSKLPVVIDNKFAMATRKRLDIVKREIEKLTINSIWPDLTKPWSRASESEQLDNVIQTASTIIKTIEENKISEAATQEMLSEYETRQKQNFSTWIAEVVETSAEFYDQLQNNYFDSTVFPELTAYLIHFDHEESRNRNMVEWIQANDIPVYNRLSAYKTYLTTDEAQAVITSKVMPLTADKYTIYNAPRVHLLAQQYKMTKELVRELKYGKTAKKQKMAKEIE